jgi:F0F1-type ATP synthase beta subunit
VAERFSGKPGEYFTLEQTLSGIEEILGIKAVKTESESKKAAKKMSEKA